MFKIKIWFVHVILEINFHAFWKTIPMESMMLNDSWSSQLLYPEIVWWLKKDTPLTPCSQAYKLLINDQKLIGLITDGDLRRELKEDDNILSKNAQSIMSKNPTTISPNISLGESLQIMEKRDPSPISLLPVVSQENSLFLGLIRLHDIYG